MNSLDFHFAREAADAWWLNGPQPSQILEDSLVDSEDWGSAVAQNHPPLQGNFGNWWMQAGARVTGGLYGSLDYRRAAKVLNIGYQLYIVYVNTSLILVVEKIGFLILRPAKHQSSRRAMSCQLRFVECGDVLERHPIDQQLLH